MATPSQFSRRSYLWLGLGLLFGLFAAGRWTVPVATWIVPVLLLRFVRQQPAWRGYLLTATGLTGVGAVTWQGLIPVPGIAFYGFVAVASFVGVLPYLADRLLTPHLSGLTATFVFPTAMTALEFLASFGDYGTWGATAYTQQHLPLLQLAAVTGIWGITFLIHWTASVLATAWATGVGRPRSRRSVLICASVLAVVVLAGSLRLTFSSKADTMQVATVMGTQTASTVLSSVGPGGPALFDSTRAVQNEYLDRVRRAAQTGVRLATWPEAAVPVLRSDTSSFLLRARQVARDEQIYLAMGLAVLPKEFPSGPLDNEVVWMGPEGRIRATYLKARPVPGEPSRAGDGRLPLVRTPDGTWTSAICFDMDFPDLLRQAGRGQADLIVAPSNDWPAITSIHAHMARVRAIENGVALLRPTSNGRTLVTDPMGRILALTDHEPPETPTLTATAPTEATWTLYPWIGDTFAWLCGIGFLALGGRAAYRSRH